jgi:hypothetical protein
MSCADGQWAVGRMNEGGVNAVCECSVSVSVSEVSASASASGMKEGSRGVRSSRSKMSQKEVADAVEGYLSVASKLLHCFDENICPLPAHC